MDPKKRVSSLQQYPVLAAFTLFFAALFVLDLVTPDRAYSELENTTLTQRPKLTAVSVDGLNNYFTNYTKYVKDQVFGRDQWISLQSLAETTLFQKTQSGGILLGREHRMFARRYRVLPTEERVWNKNLAAVQALGERYPGKVSFMLVPSASVLYPEDLPQLLLLYKLSYDQEIIITAPVLVYCQELSGFLGNIFHLLKIRR